MCQHVDMSDDPADASDKSADPTIAKVTVDGPGIAIAREVTEATMSRIIALLFGVTAAPGRGGGGGEGAGGQVGKTAHFDTDLTLGEFIVDTGAKTFPHKICAAGYYLMKQGADSFNKEEVRSALADAHEDMPANFARDWAAAASTHLIAAKQGEPGQFIIPRTGRTAIESQFVEGVRKRRAPRKTAKKVTSSSGGSAG